MPESIPFKIESRFKGMADDVRIQDFDSFFISLNFDNFSNLKKSTPYRSVETDTTDADYRIARGVLSGSKLYGLGRKSAASNVTKIYEKSANIITDAWTASTTGEDASGTPDFASFVLYEGFLFMFANATRIAAYNIAAPAFTATALNLTGYTNPAQAIVTGDGLLLVPYDNKIAVKDSGSDATSNWEAARLTLPSSLRIMDIAEWGDQVAIVCAPATADNGHSYLYIWNKSSADISSRVDLGEGRAQLVEDIDGEVMVVMIVGGDSSSNHFKAKIVTKKYLGGNASDTVHEIETDSSAVTIQRTTKIKDGTRLKFAMKCVLDGVTYHNMWVLGRKKAGYPLVLSMDHLINNDTIPTSVEGAWKIGQYHWFSFDSGTVKRTNNDNAYTATSIYISQKITARTRDLIFKWLAIICPPLPTGSTLSLYHRINSTAAWTKVFDYTTQDGLGHQQSAFSDLTDFAKFDEGQLKLTSTGGTSAPAEWSAIDGELEDLDAEAAD